MCSTGQWVKATTSPADEMMAVTGDARDVGGVATWLEKPGQEIDRGEDFQGAVDGGAANSWQLLHKLLSGEGSFFANHAGDHRPAGGCHAVAMACQQRECVEWSGSRTHGESLA
jgi:hypothetical protein